MRTTPTERRERRAALAGFISAAALVIGGCGKVFPDQFPLPRAGEGMKEATFRIVAKDYACDPNVIAIDREGRAVKVTLTVASVDKEHIFAIPDLYIRRTVPAGGEITIVFVGDRSGIFEFGCSRFPALWMNPLEKRGRLAIQ
ncbi:MAG TPA: cupredoxin domain-containing protein [Candidatus Methylomirabilis sp.]|jgi:hypothetical protein